MTTLLSTPPIPQQEALQPLSALGAGTRGVIRGTEGLDVDDAALLRAMGLGIGSRLRVFRVGEPCVVAVGGVTPHCKCGGLCRIGVARRLADRIMVAVQAQG